MRLNHRLLRQQSWQAYDVIKLINDLLQAVETLLRSNKAMGERVTQLEKVAEAYDDLKAENEKLKGELAMRKRDQHSKRIKKLNMSSSPRRH